MDLKVIFRTNAIEDLNCEIEWFGHYLNLLIDGRCVDCRSYFWKESKITYEMMLPLVEEYFNDVLNGIL